MTKLADVIVLSQDLFAIEPQRIHETRVVLTVFDGKIIYQGPGNERAALLYHSILGHPANGGFLANFIVRENLP